MPKIIDAFIACVKPRPQYHQVPFRPGDAFVSPESLRRRKGSAYSLPPQSPQSPLDQLPTYVQATAAANHSATFTAPPTPAPAPAEPARIDDLQLQQYYESLCRAGVPYYDRASGKSVDIILVPHPERPGQFIYAPRSGDNPAADISAVHNEKSSGKKYRAPLAPPPPRQAAIYDPDSPSDSERYSTSV